MMGRQELYYYVQHTIMVDSEKQLKIVIQAGIGRYLIITEPFENARVRILKKQVGGYR